MRLLPLRRLTPCTGLAGLVVLIALIAFATRAALSAPSPDSLACSIEADALSAQFAQIDVAALRRAAHDLATTWPEELGDQRGPWLEALDRLETDWSELQAGVAQGEASALARARAAITLQQGILRANPLLRQLSSILVVRRHARAPRLGLPQNWESNCVLPRTGYTNDIALLDPACPKRPLTTLYRPAHHAFVGDLELSFDADHLMFSQSDPARPWQVYEIDLDGSGLRQVTPDMGADVDNYDACYLPSGDVLFTSTATMVAVPCVNGGANVANLYRLSHDGTTVRQLCFDQEHNWCPTVLNDGRVLYLRWEYADLPHANSRRLFSMNPDGTSQAVYYGTSSYWPNSTFFARPIPGHPTQIVGIVTGHHGVPRMGELVLFDPQRGRSEATGALQRIPGFGQIVERVVKDNLADDSWPKFLHPYPLGQADGKGAGKYFLVSARPRPESLWGIYLVDVFDNLLLLKEEPDHALFEPVAVAARPRPPVIPDRIDPTRKDALVFLADIYVGPGLKGIPRGEVKSLRVLTFVYGYRGMGGLYGTVGMDGPWDVRRVLGTVPVAEDGSALFRIPANTPVAVQPLDHEGKALQLMRSWFTGMPGEVISCVGCHEPQNTTAPLKATLAARQAPADLVADAGQVRGFSFAREVQPVLDAHCITCHNGTTTGPRGPLISLRGDQPMTVWSSKLPGRQNDDWGGKFTQAYAHLHRYVRHPGIESDIPTLTPMDFHADTTELVQLLRKGHHEVRLSPEEWAPLLAWIDLNTPFHGDWSSIAGEPAIRAERRRAELRRAYANVDDFHIDPPPPPPKTPPPGPASVRSPALPPVASRTVPAKEPARPGKVGRPSQTIDLGGGSSITFVYLPPGVFTMGSEDGAVDERPAHQVKLHRGFWMAMHEITNEQFRQFDPDHDSRREHVQGYQFGMEGYPLFEPRQPVVRVSWHQAMAFCRWLSARTQSQVTLPTEAQWEYACRAGQSTPFSYGDEDTDFSSHANLADLTTRQFAADTYLHDRIVPLTDPTESDDWLPKETRFNDGALVSSVVGRYQANPWGLHDMHGNVAEWTRSTYRPYPYAEDPVRDEAAQGHPRVVRGGSWRDRPHRATASYRLAYRAYQPVYNVGFRVVIDEDRPVLSASFAAP
jgi:formylglycine-generating enzyme required for sulfatase activity